jgi:hypothetical protein
LPITSTSIIAASLAEWGQGYVHFIHSHTPSVLKLLSPLIFIYLC